jgi:hypothetical protein
VLTEHAGAFRMDFLLLAPNGARIGLEADGRR